MPDVTVAGQPATFLEAGRGRPVVLLHGAGGGGRVWTSQLAGLADVARLLALDLPGHGGTGGAGHQRIEAYASWVIQFMDAGGLDRAVLVGHSMGGATAQMVAVQHHARVTGLVLVGTGARLRVLPRLLELLREDPPRATALVGSLAYAPSTPRERVTEADRALAATPVLVTLGDFLACDRFDLTDRLGEIRAPTLVMVGQDDTLTPPKYASHLAARVPGARVVEIPGAGHFPQLEQPEAVNEAIREFLGCLPSA